MLRPLSKMSIVFILATLWPGACSEDPMKQITVEMKWQKGAIGQENRGSLHFYKGSVDCSLNFYSEESERYVESFGSAAVPVVFDVSYASGGKPIGATLVRVGEWEASKFQPNERLLATSQKWEGGKSGEARTFKIDSPGGCFDPLPNRVWAPYGVHLSVETTLLVLLSCANLGLVVVAFFYGDGGVTVVLEQGSRRTALWGTLGLGLASISQILYLALAAAWQFRWIRFYPGSPIPIHSILVGLMLSASAFVTALFGSGLKRCAGILVAITTAGLWLLSAAVSVAG